MCLVLAEQEGEMPTYFDFIKVASVANSDDIEKTCTWWYNMYHNYVLASWHLTQVCKSQCLCDNIIVHVSSVALLAFPVNAIIIILLYFSIDPWDVMRQSILYFFKLIQPYFFSSLKDSCEGKDDFRMEREIWRQ